MPILFLVVVLAGVGFPRLILTQGTVLNDCCRVKHKITLKGIGVGGTPGNIEEGAIVRSSQPGSFCDLNHDGIQDVTSAIFEEWASICLLDTIMTVTDWAFYFLTAISVAMIIYGGFVLVTSSGNPGRAETGRKVLEYVVVGLAVALLAKLVPGVVRFILGM